MDLVSLALAQAWLAITPDPVVEGEGEPTPSPTTVILQHLVTACSDYFMTQTGWTPPEPVGEADPVIPGDIRQCVLELVAWRWNARKISQGGGDTFVPVLQVPASIQQVIDSYAVTVL